MSNLLEEVSNTKDLTLLTNAVHIAGIKGVLDNDGSFTLLAPTDAAFNKMGQENLNSLFENVPKLKRVLLYHLFSGDVRSDDLKQINEAPTLEGSIVAIEHSGGKIHANEAIITELDLLVDNGVIHKIDTVLSPAIIEHEYDL
jgi:uncharacterized surface protein with fasciclin (FAS1) repeats